MFKIKKGKLKKGQKGMNQNTKKVQSKSNQMVKKQQILGKIKNSINMKLKKSKK